MPLDRLVVFDTPAVLVEPDVCRIECEPLFSETSVAVRLYFSQWAAGELHWSPRK
jgi:hypothetical protein